MEAKPDFRSLRREEVRAHFAAWAEPAYRADQVYDWLWSKGAQSFEEMSNLPKALRTKLTEEFEFRPQRIESVQRSADGTIKNAVRLHDGLVVESVLIPTEKRITACVSSQVGCAMGCAFCATARLKRMRNLEPDEIYDQVRAIDEQGRSEFGRPLTNIVFMGMGEPLMNYKNTIEAIDRITSPKLADDGVKFNLAVSLHSARDEVRAKIMPVNDVAPIEELRSSLEYWYAATKRKVTFEYVVWRDVNDQPEDIRALVELAKRVPCKVNLIEYNSIGDERFRQASPEVLQEYVDALARISVLAKVRHSRGKDIDAACGQLANKKLPAELNSLE
jgi:23S rRNA (adenine2503-C2)-methyltransferase